MPSLVGDRGQVLRVLYIVKIHQRSIEWTCITQNVKLYVVNRWSNHVLVQWYFVKCFLCMGFNYNAQFIIGATLWYTRKLNSGCVWKRTLSCLAT